ncbi:MAG TPA: HAMP domain-containing sensor histidine kinase [Myxococcota bacterium]|nr:HAMP domain-containing sensor histidine kinase [Myxococcota bacterium]
MEKSGRALVAAMATVVISFACTLWFSLVRLGAIQDDVALISENATPAIQYLAMARGELLRVALSVTECLFGPSTRCPRVRPQAQRAYLNLSEALRSYGAIPLLPEEALLAESILDDLMRLEVALGPVWLAEGDVLDVHGLQYFETIDARWQAVSADLQELINLNVAAVHRRAARIEAAQSSAARRALFFGALSLVTALVATALALRIMRDQGRVLHERQELLEARASELEAFAGRVAHDLRNPIGGMTLKVGVLQRRHRGDPTLAGALESLAGRLRAMDGIIDGLLRFARAGARPEPEARTDIAELVSRVLEQLEGQAEAAQVRLRGRNLGRTRLIAPGAVGAYESVLSNLVQNAIKHTGGAPGAARDVWVDLAAVPGRVRVSVRDAGPGVPLDQRDRVFQPFVRLDSAGGKGIGLGLATVKKIVEAHGGQVGVDSRPGEGATFWFEVPSAADSPQEVAGAARRATGSDSR